METLFRFNVVREPSRSAHEIDPIDLAANTQFQKDASEIPVDDDRPTRLRELAEEYIESSRFIPDPGSQSDLESLEGVAAAIEDLIDAGSTARFEIEAGLYDVIGSDYVDFVESSSLRGLITRAGDSLLAIKLSPSHHHLPIHRLVTVVQAFHLVQRFVEDRNFPESTEELAANRRRPLLVPEAMLPHPAPAPAPVTGRLEELAAQYDRVEQAIAELRAVRPSGYGATQQEESKAKLAPVALRPQALLKQALEAREGKTAADADDTEAPGPAGEIGAGPPGVSLTSGARVALTGRAAFQPVVAGLVGMRLSQEAQDGLSRATQTVLKDHGLSAAEPIGRTLRALIAERRRIHDQAQALVRPTPTTSLKSVGSRSVRVTSIPQPKLHALSPGQLVDEVGANLPEQAETPLLPLVESATPRIMDLFEVRQQLKGYERAEVSQITNYLRGEKTERTHRLRHETEYAEPAENEESVIHDQSLTSAERFEIRRESEAALREMMGMGVKGRYGPTFELGPSADASLHRRTLAAEKAAHDMARDVTNRASERVSERARRIGSLRHRQVEETEQRSFDNTDGLGQVSGVYQWVTKVYEAHVQGDGARIVYDFMIPGPGSSLMAALRRGGVADVELEQPPPFDLTPEQVTEDNYRAYVGLYGATDVAPPPEPFLTESFAFSSGGESQSVQASSSTTISVRDGYQAIRASVGAVVAVWDDWSVNVVVGQRAHRFSDGSSWVWSTPLDEDTGGVPVAMVTDNVAELGVTIEVVCEATERATDLWRAETHARMVEAYRARVSEFEARLADLEREAADNGPGVPGGRLANLSDAVKTATLTILSRGTPIDDDTRRQGAHARFLERAFEWENVSWAGTAGGDDPDAGHENFLNARFLRVQVPIRPGFAAAVDHLRVFGEPWLGGPLPPVSDPAYLPIAEEIAVLSTRRGVETAIGEPWEVRVPTNLEILREDDELPAWERQPDGSWEET